MTDDELIEHLLRARDRLDAAPVPMEGRLIWPFFDDTLADRNRGEPAMTYDPNAAQAPAPGSGYPVAQSTAPPTVAARALTPAEQEQCDQLYEELKPMATESARAYVLARTPANLQVEMTAKIDADWPAPPVMSDAEMASRREDANSAFRPSEPRQAVAADQPAGSTYYGQR